MLVTASTARAEDHNRPPAHAGPALPSGVTAVANTLEGIDVSHWQGTIDWPKVAAAGKKFVIMKATEGTGFVDWMYATNHAGAKAAGIRTTAYHFASPDATPNEAIAEANHFVDVAQLGDGDLIPALDLEVAGGLGTTALRNWVAAWLGQVTARLGVKPMIYVSPAFWVKYLGDTRWFADNGYRILWIAHWGVSSPTVPAQNWGGYGWTFWQYSNCGSVPGISGCVDLDRYNGTDLEAVTYHPGFGLAATPRSVSVKQGRSVSATIGVARTNFTDPVTLDAGGLPAGASASFNPNPATGSSAGLTISTSAGAPVTPVGTFPLTITGEGGGLTRTTNVNLVVTDGLPPVIAAPVAVLSTGWLGSTTAPVRIRWSATDPSGIASYRLQRQVNGGGWSTVGLPSATSTSIVQTVTLGAVYRFRVTSTDRQGNAAAWSYGRSFKALLSQQSSSLVTYGGTWRTVSASLASGGSLKYATATGAWANFSFSGSSAAWVAYLGPTRGSARVSLDGSYVGSVSSYSSSTAARRIVFAAGWGSMGAHSLKVAVSGTSGHPRVDVDAFLRLYLY
jgi:GH25 family lysozyme M1 (1,4-beta-N-acetylmuramidase)